MLSQNFIFSEKRSDRVLRHLLFWIAWGGYFILQHMASPMLASAANFMNVPFTATEGFLFLLLQVPITYFTLYVILPMYFRKKKIVMTITCFIVSWVIYYFFYQFMLKNVIPNILDWFLPEEFLRNTRREAEARIFMGLLAVFIAGFSSTAFVAGFKYLNQWYLKEKRNAELQKENSEAQLQLLTAQVHPHFLFNTLNNIYSQAQHESPKNSTLIMGLSDMLRYILFEGKKPLVPLDKELQMLKEYMHLEKSRYGEKLDLHYLIADHSDDVYIAPLLLLPFIENCFRETGSNGLENPWVNVTIELKDTTLFMKLLNGKTTSKDMDPNNELGLNSVRQRLELLYKDRHDLQVRDEEDVFILDLKVELVKFGAPENSLKQTTAEILYA